MAQNTKILIVEDDPFFAMDLEDGFEFAGYEVVGPAADVGTALQLIEDHAPDVASLDYNLGDQTSAPIARRLAELKVPFLYVTGKPSELLHAQGAPKAKIVAKPTQPETVLKALQD